VGVFFSANILHHDDQKNLMQNIKKGYFEEKKLQSHHILGEKK
jgi:hypothetical protein